MLARVERRRRCASREQHGLASRQDLRPAVGGFSALQVGHWRWRTSGGRNPRQAASDAERRDDVAILAPTAAPTNGCVAQGDCRAALHRNLLQLSWREESDPLPVRGEERSICPLRSCKLSGVGLIEPPGKEPPLRHVHHPRAVGRKDRVGSRLGSQATRRGRGQRPAAPAAAVLAQQAASPATSPTT